jgi:hypothetical protein
MHDDAAACREFEAAGDEVEQTTRPFAALKARLEEDN